MLVGEEVFKPSSDIDSCTYGIDQAVGDYNDVDFMLFDTQGLFDTAGQENKDVYDRIK